MREVKRVLMRVWWGVEAGALLVLLAPFLILPARVGIAAAGWVGRRLPLLRSGRRRIEKNLDMAMPDLEPEARRRLIAGVGDNFCRVILEYLRIDRLIADAPDWPVEGRDHVERALEAGRGVIFVSAHFGNWEPVRLAAREAGAETALIYRAFNNSFFDGLGQLRIGRAGGPVLHKGPKGMRELVRHVRGGGAALVLVDQRSGGAPLLPFLGLPAETAVAVAALAGKTGAAVIPARGRRAPDGFGFDVRFEAPVAHGAPEEMMAEVNARIGAWIEETPEQWFWLHRRWRARELALGGAPR